MPYFKPDIRHIRNGRLQDIVHHWCPRSQTFASTSHLVSAINSGWQVNTVVIRKAVTYGARQARQANLYYTELRRDGEYMTMPVVENPALIRLLCVGPFEVVDYQAQISHMPAPTVAIA